MRTETEPYQDDLERAQVKGATVIDRSRTLQEFTDPLRRRRLNIGARLTVCFVIIVFLMAVADIVAVWQFTRIEVPAQRLYEADQRLLMVMRVHLDVVGFREALSELADSEDEIEFAAKTVALREHVMQDVSQAERTLHAFQAGDEEPVFVALKSLRGSLPAQADTLVKLSRVGDWQAVRLRLANQVRGMTDLTSELVATVDHEADVQRGQALENAQRARRQLLIVLSLTAMLTFLVAVTLGWYATRSITGPLAALDVGAQALARGDFYHQVSVEGEDELARLGTAFNYAARRVRELYDQLKRNEARFRSLIEHSSDLILILDREGRICYSSPSSLPVTGLSPEEMEDRNLFEFLPPEDVVRMRSALVGTASAFEIGFLRPDGTQATIEVLTNNLLDDPAVAGVVMNARDVSERKRAEETLRDVQADLAHVSRVTTMGELTASLTHEIRQPITAAIINAQTCLRWLRRDEPNLPEAQEAISQVVKNMTRASEIIRHIGSIFKKGEPKRELIDVNDAIQEMIPLLQSEANRHALSIQTGLAADLPQVMADRVQLQQVLMNLALNGIDAMKDMNTVGRLTITSQEDGDGHLVVSVSDMGKGLPAGETNQIFKAFFSTKPQGTGMGLAISRSIIESHGGRLWATPNPEVGTTFFFSLPS
jgi:PAS domain S-box-containing protein